MNKEEQIKILDQICPFYCGKNTKRRTRHAFFEKISTEIQAYVLGLHTADGCIDDKKQMFRLRLKLEDTDTIYLIKDIIAVDARIYIDNARPITKNGTVVGKNTGDCGIDIYSKKIKDDLTNLYVGLRKTYSEIPLPNINPELIRHFIRGYFDGDGCVSWGVCKKNGEFKNWLWKKVEITSKTGTLLKDIQSFLKEKNIESNVNFRKDRNNFVFEICQWESIKRFYNLIYEESNFYLKRKYEKFSHFVNTEVSQLIAEHRNAQKVNASNSNNLSTSAEHPNGMNMCAELTGNCKNSEIKSSEDNIMRMERNDGSKCC